MEVSALHRIHEPQSRRQRPTEVDAGQIARCDLFDGVGSEAQSPRAQHDPLPGERTHRRARKAQPGCRQRLTRHRPPLVEAPAAEQLFGPPPAQIHRGQRRRQRSRLQVMRRRVRAPPGVGERVGQPHQQFAPAIALPVGEGQGRAIVFDGAIERQRPRGALRRCRKVPGGPLRLTSLPPVDGSAHRNAGLFEYLGQSAVERHRLIRRDPRLRHLPDTIVGDVHVLVAALGGREDPASRPQLVEQLDGCRAGQSQQPPQHAHRHRRAATAKARRRGRPTARARPSGRPKGHPALACHPPRSAGAACAPTVAGTADAPPIRARWPPPSPPTPMPPRPPAARARAPGRPRPPDCRVECGTRPPRLQAGVRAARPEAQRFATSPRGAPAVSAAGGASPTAGRGSRRPPTGGRR